MASLTKRVLIRGFPKLLIRAFSLPTAKNRCISVFILKNSYTGYFLPIDKFEHAKPEYCTAVKFYSKEIKEKSEKPTLFQRFKQMYKDYWYVLVPVHLVTSAAWFGSFYYMAKSGVDVAGVLETLNVSEKLTSPLKNSKMGYLAVAYGLYKIATPARYTVTLGGTTISINYLKKWGYIKPVPSTERLKEIYQEKKDNLLETMRETKEGLKSKSEQLRDKRENIIDDFDKGINRFKEKISTEEPIVGVKKKTGK